MATLQEFLRACASEIGYTESPAGSNRTKFAAEANHINGQPWCATFLVAIAKRVGLQLPSTSPYTPSMANGFKSDGRWSVSPAIGAFAFFDFPDSKYRIQHVGVVESFDATTVTTIDGNTSSGPGGSEDNGGGVFRRTRPRSYVVGYGLIDYTQESKPAPVPIKLQGGKMRIPFPDVKLDGNGNGWFKLGAGLDSDLVSSVTFQNPAHLYSSYPPRWSRGNNATDGAHITLHGGVPNGTYNVYVFMEAPA